jgi:hypothetical protein
MKGGLDMVKRPVETKKQEDQLKGNKKLTEKRPYEKPAMQEHKPLDEAAALIYYYHII